MVSYGISIPITVFILMQLYHFLKMKIKELWENLQLSFDRNGFNIEIWLRTNGLEQHAKEFREFISWLSTSTITDGISAPPAQFFRQPAPLPPAQLSPARLARSLEQWSRWEQRSQRIINHQQPNWMPSEYKVNWGWSEPCVVGNTMIFTVEFFQQNGKPYPISDADPFFVEVTHGMREMVVLIELGSESNPCDANVAKAKFTVRNAGRYIISLMIGSDHIPGSPFVRKFLPGPIDASKSQLVRPANTVVCRANAAKLLYIEPCDQFGNGCIFKRDWDAVCDFQVNVFDLNDVIDESLSESIDLTYDRFNMRILVTMFFREPVCIKVQITFKGNKIPNGEFDVIVLSSSDAKLVYKNTFKRKMHYEANLLNCFSQNNVKSRKVLCCIEPKQITIKEKFLKCIPKRIATFRLNPSTKFILLPCPDFFIIDDGIHPKIKIASKDRNIIAATFIHFLLENIGGSDTFKDKQHFFYSELRKYHSNCNHKPIPLHLNRDKLLNSSFKATKRFSVSDWCGKFEITFAGEPGIDWGGLHREFFELICRALFDSDNGLFDRFHDKQPALVHPNSNRPPSLKLKHFEFAGKIVGKCVYECALGGSNRQMIRARFTRSFLAQLIGLGVHYKHFEQDDPDLYHSKVKYILDTDLDANDDLELNFIEDVYDANGQLTKSINLIPNGSKIRVTNETKLQYLDALAQHKLYNNVQDEVGSFLKGLNAIIPDHLLSIFDEDELEMLICGTDEYSVNDFRMNHIANGRSPEFRQVLAWFWTAVSNFNKTEMAKLLQFTTGCSQLPLGGFQELSPRFQITAAPTFGNLPTAHTCFNQVNICFFFRSFCVCIGIIYILFYFTVVFAVLQKL